jgi:hypothetical protein
MKGSYAVVWSRNGTVEPGRLEPHADRFDLCDRGGRSSVLFAELTGASLTRTNGDRLRGLPVLVLRTNAGRPLRIASLEGIGVLHELVQHVAQAGLRFR